MKSRSVLGKALIWFGRCQYQYASIFNSTINPYLNDKKKITLFTTGKVRATEAHLPLNLYNIIIQKLYRNLNKKETYCED